MDPQKPLENQNGPDPIFEKARSVLFDVSPYLKTRVLAQYEERAIRSRRMRIRLAITATCFAASLAVLARTAFYPSFFRAVTREPIVVSVDVHPLQDQAVSVAEITLPDGVHFQSSEHPEVARLRQLKLEWRQALDHARLPFVVESDSSGKKQISIVFYDSAHRRIAEHKIRIEFTARQKG